MNIRVNKEEKFTQIDNEVLRDKELTMEGLALLVRLLSRPDNWQASIGELIKNGKDKSWTEGAIKRGFKNLKERGYAKLVKIYNIDSKVMQGSFYEIFEDTERGKLYPNIIYVDSNKNEVKKQTTPIQTGLLSDTSGTPSYINKEPTNKENKNIIISDEQLQVDKVSVKMYEQNTDGNCTFPILDSTEPIYEPKPKETKPKVKEKKPSKYDANPERFKFINEKTKEWNLTASDDIKIRPPRKGEKESNNWVISRLYDKFGLEKAEIIFNYVMSKGNYRQPHGLLSTKNVQDALASYQDPNDEQPRFLIDFWKTMRRFSKPDSLEPFELDFNTEDALYAAWEWYFNGKGLEGGALVKAVREKIKQINHPRFNKY